MTQNSLTALAACNGEPAQAVALRPPLVRWTLRLLDAATLPENNCSAQRSVIRDAERAGLSDAERAAIYHTTLRCLQEIRQGAADFEAAS